MKMPTFHFFGLGPEKDYFIEQLAMLLSSGIPVLEALSAIKAETRNKLLKNIIEDIEGKIAGGSSISAALESTGVFSQSIISLIRIGEQSGRLPENLRVIALQEQKEREFRSKVASSMLYPLFVFSLTLIVGVGIAWFLLPRLAVVFAQLNVELPLITRILIAIGHFLGQYGVVVIPAVLLFGLLFLFFLFIFPKTKFIGQTILFKVPVIKKLLQEVEIARFGYTLGNLLKAGLPVVDSLASLRDATMFYPYKDLYSHLYNRVEEGNFFQKSFALYQNTRELLPVPVQQLIATSEKSGNLPETLISIGEMYETKTETTTKNLTVLLEPILLVIVWLGVVAVALAVILPLYSLIGGFNQ